MMNETNPDREALAALRETVSTLEQTLPLAGDATIVPETWQVRALPREQLPTLPVLRTVDGAVAAELRDVDLRWKGTIGQGGMGLIRLADQVALHREVAVKTLRSGVGRGGENALLKEAHVTGRLEHPNIIPVYTLGSDDEGSPLIVMKRIEGVSWSTIIRDPGSYSEPVDLEWHVRVLLSVCNALRYAHSRGIVHRDIKPENVMIGNFGEVYLLDWGIAVSLEPGRDLPWKGEARGVAGTPAYMAPEMTDDDAERIDERTDVYLLGATLHEVVTGRTRHEGEQLFDLFASALRSEAYAYGPEVPEELASILNRACARELEDRFQGVEAFQEALARFLEHRESIQLSVEAQQSLDRLEELWAEGDSDASGIHDLYGECRFGFRQALRIWGENEQARRGMERLLEGMFHDYLARENLAGARALLGEFGPVSEELRERVRLLEERLAGDVAEVSRLKKLAKELDLRRGAGTRSRLAIFFGMFWGVTTAWAWWRELGLPSSEQIVRHWESYPRSVVIVGLGLLVFRRRVFANAANRRVIYTLLFMVGCMGVMRWAGWYTSAEFLSMFAAEQVMYSFAVAAVALLSDLRMFKLAAVYLVAAVAGLLWPYYQVLMHAGANLVVFFGLAWYWRRGAKPREKSAIRGFG